MQWNDLGQELSRWADAGVGPRFWWRDDDAAEAVPALTRLLDLAVSAEVEVGLAAIPALASPALAEEVGTRPYVVALQHGYRHRNHAAPGQPAVECGGDRPVEETLDELRRGRERMAELFGERFVPVLAAPWNNIDDAVALRLDSCGLTGLSAYGPRARQKHTAAIAVVNVHVDPLNWRAGGRFAGTEKALSGIIGELRSRRTGATEPGEPLGLLTHHLNHDDAMWDFLERLFGVTRAHPAARWLSVGEAFALDRAAAGRAS